MMTWGAARRAIGWSSHRAIATGPSCGPPSPKTTQPVNSAHFRAVVRTCPGGEGRLIGFPRPSVSAFYLQRSSASDRTW